MFTGFHLRDRRKQCGLTQQGLADVVHMSREAIAQIEAQNREISNVETLKALQKTLGIPYEEIGFIPIEDVIKVGKSVKVITNF